MCHFIIIRSLPLNESALAQRGFMAACAKLGPFVSQRWWGKRSKELVCQDPRGAAGPGGAEGPWGWVGAGGSAAGRAGAQAEPRATQAAGDPHHLLRIK